MSDDALEDLIAQFLPRLTGLGAVVVFDLGADGRHVVDARGATASLASAAKDGEDDGATKEDGDGDCTIRISAENLVKLLGGKLDPMVGYAMGRIKIAGSRDVAMRLVKAIG